MEENQVNETNTENQSVKKKATLEEKTELLIKKISEVANENLELKDRLYQQKDHYFQQEKQIRSLRKQAKRMRIELETSTSSVTERANTVKTLAQEIHNIKTLVRYLLSHEITNFYHASYHMFMLPKLLVFPNLRQPSWAKIKSPIVTGFKALKTMLLMPVKLRQIYYYRKLKKENPLTEEFRENLDPSKVNSQMRKDLRKSWMLKQLVERESFLVRSFPPYLPESTEGTEKKILRVACILDEFSFSCFQYEAHFTQLDFDHWEEQLAKETFDLLLVESAWKGKNLRWKDQIGGLEDSKNTTLGRLIKAFKTKGVPTVFWNKEDPPHYHHFLEAAKLFDFVFTSDENQIPRYKEALGHSRIESLSFACQPILHNPIGSQGEKVGEIAFAGSWHENRHEKRKVDMHNLLRPALQYKLHIFDRMADHLLDNYIFPFEYQHTVQGCLPYNRMLTAYRNYRIFLNVNSVQNSRTMFSRRVYEIAACGVNVVSGYTKGIEHTFGKDLICESSSEEDTAKHLENLLGNPLESQKRAHRAKRVAYEKHTYARRLEKILDTVGFSIFAKPKKVKVAVFAELSNPNHLEHLLENFKKQNHEEKTLHLLCHTAEIKEFCSDRIEAEQNPSILLHEKKSPSSSFYEFLFPKLMGIEFDFLTLFHENSHYSENFLKDFLHTFLYSGTSLATKETHYTFCRETNTVLEKSPLQEHQVASSLNEKCFLAKREVFLDPYMKERLTVAKQGLKDSCLELEYDVYNSDRFNYLEVLKEESNNDKEIPETRKKAVENLEEALHFITA